MKSQHTFQLEKCEMKGARYSYISHVYIKQSEDEVTGIENRLVVAGISRKWGLQPGWLLGCISILGDDVLRSKTGFTTFDYEMSLN